MANREPNPKAESAAPSPELTFEAALARLEKLVRDLEGGHLSLEQSLASFEEGMELVRRCSRELMRIEARVKVLTEEAGRILERDWTGGDSEGAPGGEPTR
jgi:exodeoxyribonuclease VII small subunit